MTDKRKYVYKVYYYTGIYLNECEGLLNNIAADGARIVSIDTGPSGRLIVIAEYDYETNVIPAKNVIDWKPIEH